MKVPGETSRPEGWVRSDAVSAAKSGATNVGRAADDPSQGDGGSATEPKTVRNRRFEVRLSEDELALFDDLAAKMGTTRSEVVRSVAPAVGATFDKAIKRAARRAVADADQLEAVRAMLAEHTAALNAAERQLRADGYHLMHLLRHARSGGNVPEEALLELAARFEEYDEGHRRAALRVAQLAGVVSWL